ncbi:putative transporter [Trachipleistophora hominis]|uniref:Putative transporter n=1 Tax=Trachipleistophora hominis TaxID=72359 RepID=L7K0E3_TRAHO|nr:putative transporter [Trachipleistophora hominis]
MFKLEDFASLRLVDVLQPIIPLIVVSATLNMCRIYSKLLTTTQPLKIILPVTLTYFIPPLIANLVYKQFYVNNIVIGSFFIGCLLFPVMSRMPYILEMSASLCYIGKFGLFSSMRDSKEPVSNVTLWLIVNEFVSIFILKVLSNEHLFSISEGTVVKTLGNIILIYLCRIFHVNDVLMILLIIMVDILLYLKQKYLGQGLANVRINDRQGLKHYFKKRVDMDTQIKKEQKTANGDYLRDGKVFDNRENVKNGGSELEAGNDQKGRKNLAKNGFCEGQEKFQSANSEMDSMSESNTVRLSDIQDMDTADITASKKEKTTKTPKTPKKNTKAKQKDITELSDEKKSSVEKQTKKASTKTPRRKK